MRRGRLGWTTRSPFPVRQQRGQIEPAFQQYRGTENRQYLAELTLMMMTTTSVGCFFLLSLDFISHETLQNTARIPPPPLLELVGARNFAMIHVLMLYGCHYFILHKRGVKFLPSPSLSLQRVNSPFHLGPSSFFCSDLGSRGAVRIGGDASIISPAFKASEIRAITEAFLLLCEPPRRS